MFTGLVEDLGRLESCEETADGAVLSIETTLVADLREGDSIAVNGVCLTATAVLGTGFTAEVMNQTLTVTALGEVAPGDRLNLELAAALGSRLGGHLVQGHVDGTGEVIAVEQDGFARRLRVAVPSALAPYLIEHGSVTLNGVSLTIASLAPVPSPDEDRTWFEVSLIPETQERTNLGLVSVGSRMNVECDMIARYVERQLATRR